MKRLIVWLLCALLFMSAAVAEDSFTIDVDTLDLDRLNSDDYVAVHLSDSAQGIRILKWVSGSSEVAEPVRLTLTQMASQTLLFDKNYGYQSGTFDSGVIYLPFAGEETTPYLVTLYVSDYVYALPFMHKQPPQEAGDPAQNEQTPSDDWFEGWEDSWEDNEGEGWSDGWEDGWDENGSEGWTDGADDGWSDGW